MAEDEQGMAADLSSDDLSAEDLNLDEGLLKEKQLLFNFKRYTFWIAAAFSAIFFIALLYYIFCGSATAPSERIAVVGILAAIPTIILLALLRYVFTNHQNSHSSDGENYSLWQSFLKELTVLIKGLAEKKP